MKPNRNSNNAAASASSRKRVRRDEDTLISALRDKIAKLEERKVRRAMKGDPVLKTADKLVRQLKKAEKTFVEAGRIDLANSVKAAAISMQQTATVSR